MMIFTDDSGSVFPLKLRLKIKKYSVMLTLRTVHLTSVAVLVIMGSVELFADSILHANRSSHGKQINFGL